MSSVRSQLVCTNLGFAYAERTVLSDVTVTIAPGDRIGIVGPNGTGKTTLLRLWAGELTPQLGTVTTAPDAATVGLLTQQLEDRDGETVGELIRRRTGTDLVIAEFEAAVAALADGAPGSDERYDLALERYIATEAATIDERIERTLATVGLASLDVTRLCQELSGGQRSRVNLAAVLLASFDVLLLDEPTNDLDLDGLALLEDLLLSQDRPVAVVSHDRAFLERVVTAIYELDDHSHSGTLFNGGFAAWEQARAVARDQHYEAYAVFQDKRSQLKERAQTQQQWAWAGAGRAKKDTSEKDKFIRAHRVATSEKIAGKARQTERALERLERNEAVEAPWEPWELNLTFAPAERSGVEVASLSAATVHRVVRVASQAVNDQPVYGPGQSPLQRVVRVASQAVNDQHVYGPGRPPLQRGDFTLGPISVVLSAGDRVLITGANGSGKSTLLAALLGEIELSSGTGQVGPSVRVAKLRQERDLFADAPSLLRGFTDATGLDDQAARSQLAKLGLDAKRIDRAVGDLSPGERTRAALGLFVALGSNLLVLDEPTNHLDLAAIEALEAALAVFPHTVLLVTHDRRLIETVETNRRWHLAAGRLTET